MDGRTAETIAEDLSRQIKERIQQENAREQEVDGRSRLGHIEEPNACFS